MKVILTGSTGFIGSEVLKQCLQHSQITSIIALSRRELPSSTTQNNPKLKVVLMEDFASYSNHVMEEIKGADACIWSLGKALVASDEEARRISFDFTLAAAKACNEAALSASSKRCRFVYLSGMIAERDQNKPLWYMEKHRRIRGQLETDLINFAARDSSHFETYIMKPSMVLSEGRNLMDIVPQAVMPTVRVNTLASAMINIATQGREKQTFENADINQLLI